MEDQTPHQWKGRPASANAGGRPIWPTSTLLEAYAARNPHYVLFQPDDMPEAHWQFVLAALAFAEKACEEVLSTPAGPPD